MSKDWSYAKMAQDAANAGGPDKWLAVIKEAAYDAGATDMTDDFLATIRNAEMTEDHFPVLMITSSAIDTITSGTGDLSATGMPFNSAAIIEKIKIDIADAQLPLSDQILLEMELARKQADRFSDKSSLYEYAEFLTVLGRGYVKKEDYSSFSLLYDPAVQPLQDPKKIRDG